MLPYVVLLFINIYKKNSMQRVTIIVNYLY